MDGLGRPAQRQRPALQVVLPRGGVGVVDDLVEGRLADIEVGVAGQPGGRHLGHGVAAHGGMASLSGNEDGNGAGAGDAARARARAWWSVSWAITAMSWLVAAGRRGGPGGGGVFSSFPPRGGRGRVGGGGGGPPPRPRAPPLSPGAAARRGGAPGP